jgi:hypothetical protein
MKQPSERLEPFGTVLQERHQMTDNRDSAARMRAYRATPEGKAAKRAADARYRAKRQQQDRPEPPPTPPAWAPRAISAEEKLIDGLEASPAAEEDLSEVAVAPVEDDLEDAHLVAPPRRDPLALEHTGYRARIQRYQLEELAGDAIDLLGRSPEEIPTTELWHIARSRERRAETARRRAEAELDRRSLDPH